MVGKPNEFAYAAARNIAEQDRPLPERNPLYIFGGVGLGKTHLMHAIWHSIRERDPKTRVLYLTAESFVNRFIQALRTKNTGQFKELFRNVDVLMVDDVQFICGKEASQDEFFFTFNSLVEQNKQIVLSSEKPPSELQDIEERMRSRLGSGLVADIHSSTYELRLSILQTKAENARVPVPIAVLEFLAHKISTNIRELEGRAQPRRRPRPADRPRDHRRDGAGRAARPACARPIARSRSTRSSSGSPRTTTSSSPR